MLAQTLVEIPYKPDLNLPFDHVKTVLNTLADHTLGDLAYPAYIIDRYLTFWMFNSMAKAILGRTSPALLLDNAAHLFDIQFNSHFEVHSYTADLSEVQVEQVRRFKRLHRLRQSDPFVCDYPSALERRMQLSGENYLHFAHVWQTTHPNQPPRYPKYKGFPWSMLTPDGEQLFFQAESSPIDTLAGGLFFKIVHYPLRDAPLPDNRIKVERYLNKYRSRPENAFKLWQILGKNRLFNYYEARFS